MIFELLSESAGIKSINASLDALAKAVPGKMDATAAAIKTALGFTPANAVVGIPRYNVEQYRTAGMSDHATLQAAMDAATSISTEGCQVILTAPANKVYTVLYTGLQVPGNIILDGISFKGSSNTTDNTGAKILNLTNTANNVIIRNCFFNGTAMNSTRSSGGSSAITQATGYDLFNVHIHNNKFKMPPKVAATGNAETDSENNGSTASIVNNIWGTFSHNFCDQCSGDIFNFNGGFVIITDNIAMNGGDGGIALNNGINGIASGNYIKNTSLGVGIGPNPGSSYLIVANNSIDGSSFGINAGDYGTANGAPCHLIVDGNNIRNAVQGIVYNSGSNASNKVLRITNNMVSDGSNAYGVSGNYDGIIVNGCRGATITGNTVDNCAGWAFYFSGSVDVVYSQNTARNCGYPVLWQPALGQNSAHVGDNFYLSNANQKSVYPNPQIMVSGKLNYSGTLDSNGAASVPHNLPGGVADAKRIERFSGFALTVGNALVPLTLNVIDGTNIQVATNGIIQGNQPNRPFDCTIWIKPTTNY